MCAGYDGDRLEFVDDPGLLRQWLETFEPRWPEHALSVSKGSLSGDALLAVATMISYAQTGSPAARAFSTENLQHSVDGARHVLARSAHFATAYPEADRARMADMLSDTDHIRTVLSPGYARSSSLATLHGLVSRYLRGRWQFFLSGPENPLITSDFPAVHWLDRDGGVAPMIYFPIRRDCGAVVLPAERRDALGAIGDMSLANCRPADVQFGHVTAEGAVRLNELVAKQARDHVFSSCDMSDVIHAIAGYRKWQLHQRFDKVPTASGTYVIGRRVVSQTPDDF